MFVSEARIAANRRNSALSTGPKTPEGKERSRANALKHGLCSSVVVTESLELVQQRSCEFFDTLKPQNELHVWMVDQAALMSVRIDRCQRIERRVRDKIALRAELAWDDDRRFEVEVLARSLAKDPAATVEALHRTSHGCEWMITRWAMLAYSADLQTDWTEEQTRLAFDLLATPSAFRQAGKPGVELDSDGRPIRLADDSAAVARRQIAALKERRDVVADLDEVDRALASSDLTNEGDPELRRLRRYESTLHSQMRWCIKQIDIQSPYRLPDASLRPSWVVDPKPAPVSKPAAVVVAEVPPLELVDPPVAPEPAEVPSPDEDIVMPILPSPRREKAIRKAESRREAGRKKLDKLRA